MEYSFTAIEQKWSAQWAKDGIYRTTDDASKPKYYVLDMFPYPSGAGLHVGHPLGYVASDIYARYKRLRGYNVLHPMGYDAFGLPAEQYAIETGTPPQQTTDKAIATYRSQLDKIGFSYDWSREVRTCDPAYYKWTQWIFLQLYGAWYNREKNKAESIYTLIKRFETHGTMEWSQHHASAHDPFTAKEWQAMPEANQQHILMNYRLAFQSDTEVNWCEALGTVLANDEVKDGRSERGGYPVERRKMRQWSLRITEYADRLLQGLDTLDWSESMKDMQRHWIGRSEGAIVKFTIDNGKLAKEFLEIFTTRPDTVFGATFMVIAPEHELVEGLTTLELQQAVSDYITYVKSRSDIERQQEKAVTGVFTGSYALNPFTHTQIPIYIAEYVLKGYGTGAIMAVPANDERDRRFAEKFGLDIIPVIDQSAHPSAGIEDKVGVMINSGFITGMQVKEAIHAILEEIEYSEIGERKVNYRLRDAGYSRQRYWGEPFPIQYKNGIPYPIPESELPLVLPQVNSYKPAGDGRAPLANNADWVANGYETDTMPGYAGSSWYFLRYMDPQNEEEFVSKAKVDYWQSVDLYLGGSEHAVGHLLYARFWHKFLHDMGYVPTDEPFKKLVNQGMIQGVSQLLTYTEIDCDQTLGWDENDKRIFANNHVTLRLYGIFKKSVYPSGILEPLHPSVTKGRTWRDFSVNDTLYFVNSTVSSNSWHIPVSHIDEKGRLSEASFKELLHTNYLDLPNADFENTIFWIVDNGKRYIQCEAVVEKMSKRYRNVVNPDDVVAKYGADCFRMFEMFLGPLEQSKPWDDKGIDGVSKFLKRFWRLFFDDKGNFKVTTGSGERTELKVLHKTLKKVAEDIERLQFNTCVSAFMIAVNELTDMKCSKREILEPLLIALAPFAPFMTEELWHQLGHTESIHLASYPTIDEQYLVESEISYPISINGKTRINILMPADISEEDARQIALADETVMKWCEGKAPKKFIFVKGRIINVVV